MGAIEQFVESVMLLALDSDSQFKALPSFVFVPDELAITFCDAYEVAKARIIELWDPNIVRICDELYAIFDNMTLQAPEEFFNNEAVRSDARWEAVRVRAKEILQNLNRKIEIPQLRWMKYVPG